MSVTDSEAHAAVGASEVKVGDRIAIYQSRCDRFGCHSEKKGEGRVEKAVNADYVVIVADPGVPLRKGYYFEKVS